MKNIERKITLLLQAVMILYALGNTTAATPSSHPATGHCQFSINTNPFAYSIYYHDAESDFYYLKARYYSSRYDVFTSRDTYDLSNRFAYCDGNPVMNVDPKGHMKLEELSARVERFFEYKDECSRETQDIARKIRSRIETPQYTTQKLEELIDMGNDVLQTHFEIESREKGAAFLNTLSEVSLQRSTLKEEELKAVDDMVVP